MLIAFNKPYNVLTQFRAEGDSETLASYIKIPDIYPAGRLDKNSEGLLLLTDDGALQHRITDPKHKLAKTYWVQVEGIPDKHALEKLCIGVVVQGKCTRPAQVLLMNEPEALWPRQPPIRVRKRIADSWLELTIKEGRNRQVRHMTAAVGHPTLRLIRSAIGPWALADLRPGQWREIDTQAIDRVST
ncbi:MAG: pseudouridine synthase [Gammaproteobacteria bacterium]|nr:MAG: pseudouridine synthase [Gammaproteobacteria bacterium]